MVRIRDIDLNGSCIRCKSKVIGNHEPCWREATEEELYKEILETKKKLKEKN